MLRPSARFASFLGGPNSVFGPAQKKIDLLAPAGAFYRTLMPIGDRLRELREAKKLSQGDIENRTGLKRSYISRVENGHTVPAVETLEKFARAFEVPLYQLFYQGEEPPRLDHLPARKTADEIAWGSRGKDARMLAKLRKLLARMSEKDRMLLMYAASRMRRR